MSDKPEYELGGLFDGVEEAKDTDEGTGLTPKDRPRGILSQTDREYLCGQKEYAHAQTESNRKQEIRERVRNGLEDITLLWLLLDPSERNNIFDELGQERTDHVIESMVTFAYLGVGRDLPRLEERIERGILLGANIQTEDRESGPATNVDVSISIDYDPDLEALYEKVQEGNADQLTPSDIGALVRAGKLDPEDLDRLEDPGPMIPDIHPSRE